MARPRLPRCRLCGKPVHDNPISIVFFYRKGDRFMPIDDDRLYNTITDMYCPDCAFAINAVLGGEKLTAAGGGGVTISRT